MKKLLAIALAIVFALGVCSFASAEQADTSLFITDEPVEFTLLMRGDANIITAEDFWFFDFCEKFLNVKLIPEAIDSSVFMEKLNILMGTDSMPDLIMASATIWTAEMANWGQVDHLFLAIDEYKEYAPKFFAELDAQSDELYPAVTCPDGHIYGFSNIHIVPEGQSQGIFTIINVDWLERLDLEMPTTLDEFYDVLCAFRDEDANGDGDPTNEIPWQASYNSGYPERMFVMWAYGYNGYRWNEVDSTTLEGYFAPYCPRYKEAVEFMKKCWDEGLIQATFFSGDNQSNCAFGQANTDNTYYGFSVDVSRAEITGNKDFYGYYEAQIPLVVDDNITRTTWKGLSLDLFTWTINANCEYPEVAVSFCDFWYDPYWALCYAYGPEYGTQYDLYGNGWVFDAETQQFSFPANVDNTANFGHYHNIIMDGASFGLDPASAAAKYFEGYKTGFTSDPEEAKWQKSLAENNVPYEFLECSDYFYFTPEEMEVYNMYKTPLQNFMMAQEAAFISGERDWSEWDEYMKELDDMGGQEFNEFVKGKYAEFYGNAQ